MKKFWITVLVVYTLYAVIYAQQPPTKKSIESQAFIGTCACDFCECCE